MNNNQNCINIPKIIHQIWLGPKKPPQWCIDSWKINYINSNPDWEYKLWTEKEINDFKLINENIYDKEPTYRGKSDIARYEILFREGGIFLDADSLWINNKSLNNLFDEIKQKQKQNNLNNTDISIKNKITLADNEDILFGANEPTVNNHLIANGVIGCNKNNKIMYSLINYLKNTYSNTKLKHNKDHQIWLVTGPIPFNEILKTFRETNLYNLYIFPSYYFFPEKFVNGNIKMTTQEIERKFPRSFMYQYWLSHYN